MVYVLLADGFEEIEALSPVDLLRRVGQEVSLVGIDSVEKVGARGVRVAADCLISDVDTDKMDMLILPGGYPGYENLDQNKQVHSLIDAAFEKGAFVAAICGAPSILGKRGDLEGKTATCYPGMEDTLQGAVISDAPVCVDGKVITSRSAATALAFSLALCEILVGKEKTDILRQQIVSE